MAPRFPENVWIPVLIYKHISYILCRNVRNLYLPKDVNIPNSDGLFVIGE
jgi:hypothetical protein